MFLIYSDQLSLLKIYELNAFFLDGGSHSLSSSLFRQQTRGVNVPRTLEIVIFDPIFYYHFLYFYKNLYDLRIDFNSVALRYTVLGHPFIKKSKLNPHFFLTY